MAIKLAQKLPIQIVSVDSVMVYKGCDIGSAKPSKAILEEFPHEMVDIVNPSQIFTVSDFCNLSNKIIEKSHKSNRLPLFVGGSMMYFRSLLDGMHNLPERDNNFREELEKLKLKNEPYFLFKLLENKDPEYAQGVDKNDEMRIVRALEIINKTGNPFSNLLKKDKKESLSDKYSISQFGILDDRHLIHERIEERLKLILSSGLEEEAIKLDEKYDIAENHPIRKSVNYKQIFKYINGEYDIETFHERALFASRQLAKRQTTWIRGWKDFTETRIGDFATLEDNVKKVISLL